MEKLLYFWVDKSHKRATNSTGIRANWINCLLYILKVLLNLHNFPSLNLNCTEPYLGPLYRSYTIVQILNCKIPERGLLNGAIWKRFSKVSPRWRCAACHLLQVFTMMPDSWYAERGTRFPLCIAQNAKWTDSENNFALDVIFQNETVRNFCLKNNVLLFFREAWNAFFYFSWIVKGPFYFPWNVI